MNGIDRIGQIVLYFNDLEGYLLPVPLPSDAPDLKLMTDCPFSITDLPYPSVIAGRITKATNHCKVFDYEIERINGENLALEQDIQEHSNLGWKDAIGIDTNNRQIDNYIASKANCGLDRDSSCSRKKMGIIPDTSRDRCEDKCFEARTGPPC